MIYFNFDDTRVGLPESWEEVTVDMFINPLFLAGDSLGLLSALSGIPKEKLANTTEDLNPYFNKCAKFIKANPQGWRGEWDETITILEKTCTIPTDIELKMYGQKVMYGQALTKHDNIYAAMPEAIAIYLAPQIYGEDWYEKIDELAEEVKKLPITKIFSIADFFLSSIQPLKQDGSQS